MRPAAQLYALAGSPPQDRCVELDPGTRCRVCGDVVERGGSYEAWQGANFTDQNKLRWIAARHVCEACVWAHAWNPPPGAPAAAPGKKGLNLRLFSHLLDDRGYLFVNKGDKPTIRRWLCEPKRGRWWAAIADSGQKHIVPWATINADPYVGIVRFEEADVLVDSRLAAEWCAATCALLTAGATKTEIEAGEYRPETWMRCEATVRDYERRYGPERGGGWFALTVWLSQRDEDAVASRMAAEKEAKDGRRKTRSSARRGGRPADDRAGRIPSGGGKRAEALAADPRPGASRDEDERADQRVGDDACSRAPARKPEQLSLLGADRPVR